MYILSARFPGRPASDPDMKIHFGLGPKDKWPDAGLPQRTLPSVLKDHTIGIVAYVLGKHEIPEARQGVPRCMVICPKCGVHVSFSRLPQHYRIHE
jgi:hypothetical protein